jgi:hypothetical protein
MISEGYRETNNKWEQEKGGTYYIIFPDDETRRAVINFVDNEYSKTYPIKAAEDPGNPVGVKLDFNNSAHKQKDLLLKIFAQRGWHAVGQSFVENIYQPAPLTEPVMPLGRPAPKFGVYEGGKPAEKPRKMAA